MRAPAADPGSFRDLSPSAVSTCYLSRTFWDFGRWRNHNGGLIASRSGATLK